jgi:hypothetical protein
LFPKDYGKLMGDIPPGWSAGGSPGRKDLVLNMMQMACRFCPGFSECRVFSAGMKIVIDKNRENTVWQCFWRLFGFWTIYAYLRHLESYYCILRWIKCIRGHPVGAWARPPSVGRTLVVEKIVSNITATIEWFRLTSDVE